MPLHTSLNTVFFGEFAQEAAKLTANMWRSWSGDKLRQNQIEDLEKLIREVVQLVDDVLKNL